MGQDTASRVTRGEDEGHGDQGGRPKQTMVVPGGNEMTAGERHGPAAVVANTGVAALQHEGKVRAVPVRWVSSQRMMSVAETELGPVMRVGQRTAAADHSVCPTNHQRQSWRVQHLWIAALQTLLGRTAWMVRWLESWQTCTPTTWNRCWMRASILIDAAIPQLW